MPQYQITNGIHVFMTKQVAYNYIDNVWYSDNSLIVISLIVDTKDFMGSENKAAVFTKVLFMKKDYDRAMKGISI